MDYKALWHPIHINNAVSDMSRKWSIEEFNKALTVLNKFRDTICTKTSDIPDISDIPSSNKIYEAHIKNKYTKNVESYCNVDISNWKDWWMDPKELALIQKYGWSIEMIDI